MAISGSHTPFPDKSKYHIVGTVRYLYITPIYLSTYLSTYLSLSLSMSISISLSIYIYPSPSIHTFIHTYLHISCSVPINWLVFWTNPCVASPQLNVCSTLQLQLHEVWKLISDHDRGSMSNFFGAVNTHFFSGFSSPASGSSCLESWRNMRCLRARRQGFERWR